MVTALPCATGLERQRQEVVVGVQGMQTAAQVSELAVPLHCRVAWLRKNYSYFEDEHREVLMDKLDALTKTSGKKVFAAAPHFLPTYKLSCTAMCCTGLFEA